ncbi:type 1 glutamine amidotransferase family protein [Nocardiopsis sp. LOL_012]|uniref:type 1 glutamine amidotransferase family protein n=1 Tax=Nocardiopsis sp. LOL_012 TaxID=3345409 RepID=UPI003A8BC9C1
MSSSRTRTVHVAVYDHMADWEIGHVLAHLRSGEAQRRPGGVRVATVGMGDAPVTTMGGLTVLPDIALPQLKPSESSMLILPGADTWDCAPEAMSPFSSAAGIFLDTGVPVAAICGATAGLAREGLLDDRAHTSAAPEYLLATGYAGFRHYRDDLAVTDGDLITANPIAPVEFAREIFRLLDVYSPRVLDAWYRLFGRHDRDAYTVLAEASRP